MRAVAQGLRGGDPVQRRTRDAGGAQRDSGEESMGCWEARPWPARRVGGFNTWGLGFRLRVGTWCGRGARAASFATPRCSLYARSRAHQPPLQSTCPQVLGGNGYVNDYPTGRLLRDAKLYEIGAGGFGFEFSDHILTDRVLCSKCCASTAGLRSLLHGSACHKVALGNWARTSFCEEPRPPAPQTCEPRYQSQSRARMPAPSPRAGTSEIRRMLIGRELFNEAAA